MQHHINRLRSLVSQLVLKAPDFPGNVELAREIGEELDAIEVTADVDALLSRADSTPTIEVAVSDLIDDDSPTLVNAHGPFASVEIDTTPTAFIPPGVIP
jgi:hypothetical protein